MIRIGVLTFHSSINNGAVIQCYSLVKRLQQEFPDSAVEVIDYRMPSIEKTYEVSIKAFLNGYSFCTKLKRLVVLIKNPRLLAWRKERKQAFEKVINLLPLSEKKILDGDQKELFDFINIRYNIIVVGSDAIWNYTSRGFPNPYFLSEDVKIPKFSYAASCYGMDYEKIPEKQKEIIKNVLNQYSLLGIRDEESEKFIEYVGGSQNYFHTCDPTVFLNVSDLPVNESKLKCKLQKKGYSFDKKTIGVMGNDALVKMIKAMYGKQYQIVALYNYSKYADVNLHDISPFEWAFIFQYFILTFTTFFHGTLLSMRNGTPVICIALETAYAEKHKTKVFDFLERVGLEDCYFHTDYKSLEIEKIKKKSDELIERMPREKIIAMMNKEAETANKFFKILKKKLKETERE